jgi:hypothetical protein
MFASDLCCIATPVCELQNPIFFLMGTEEKPWIDARKKKQPSKVENLLGIN